MHLFNKFKTYIAPMMSTDTEQNNKSNNNINNHKNKDANSSAKYD